MATSSSSHSCTAPWRTLLLSHISLLPMPTFTFCTLSPAPPSSPLKTSDLPFLPRARTCVFRSMFGEVYSPSPSPSTPTYASELLTFTTDVRMEKVGQLFHTSHVLNDDEVDVEGSGGGGPCEAVFWVEEMKTQWRVRGDAWVLSAADIEEDAEGARRARNILEGRMRTATPIDGKDGNTTTKQCEGEWSWKKEIEAHWEILPQGVKRSFGNTSPGLFRKSGDQADRTGDGKENFRVCVIRPFEVEQLDLRISGEGRCWRYIYKEDVSAKKENDLAAGGWKTEELWP